ARDRIVSVTDADGGVYQLSYDDNGIVTSITNAMAHTMSFPLDSRGLPARFEMPGGSGLTFERTLGDISTVTDARGQIWRFDRDPEGRVVRREDPLGNEWTTQWDNRGRRTTETFAD